MPVRRGSLNLLRVDLEKNTFMEVLNVGKDTGKWTLTRSWTAGTGTHYLKGQLTIGI